MINLKALRIHLSECIYLERFDIEILREFTSDDCDRVILRSSRMPAYKVFNSNRAAKAWLTRQNNKIQCDNVDRRLGLGKYSL